MSEGARDTEAEVEVEVEEPAEARLDGAKAWTLDADGHHHEVLVRPGTVSAHRVQWWRDGVLVGTGSTHGRALTISSKDDLLGRMRVRLTDLGAGREITWVEPADPEGGAQDLNVREKLGRGLDLDPPEGSGAARRRRLQERWPTAYVIVHGLGRAAAFLVPVLLAYLAVRIPWPSLGIDLPDLPRIPTPDLPDLPAIPWPDWSLPPAPEWVRTAIEVGKYVVPVLVAMGIAAAQVRRNRRQAELRERRRTARGE